ncbi:MAG: hypothetical protein V4657_09090 [Pseudomonadota bacterium]
MNYERCIAVTDNTETSSLSLSLPDDLSFEQWQDVGRNLAARGKVLNWWIGDWWAAGDHRYGDRAKVAAEGLFGKEFGSLANAASVCRVFETSRRRERLSWSHHVEVAPLSPEQADEVLEQAEQIGMSVMQVRAVVRELQGIAPLRIISLGGETLNGFLERWNRLPRELRSIAAELIEEADGEEIQPVKDGKIALSVEDSKALIDEVDRWCRRTGTNYNKLVVTAGVGVTTRHKVRMKGQAVSVVVAARLRHTMHKNRHGITKKKYKITSKPWGGPYPEDAPKPTPKKMCKVCGGDVNDCGSYCQSRRGEIL